MSNINHKPSVIILAAGLSGRMGKPKPFLRYNNDSTFIERLIDVYKEFGSEKIILVTNAKCSAIMKEQFPSACRKLTTIVNNLRPKAGRFQSILFGLMSIEDNKDCFIQNVDNPCTSVSLLESMTKSMKHGSFVVPEYQGNSGHPLLISGIITDTLKEQDAKDKDLRTLLCKFEKIKLDTSDNSVLLNINTEKDYKDFMLTITI